MELNEKRVRILKLIRRYAPKDTEFYWDNSINVKSVCKYKYCKHLDEFYDFEIVINENFAQKAKWEELQKYAIQEIAHARLPKHIKDKFWEVECHLLMALIEEDAAAKKILHAKK